MTAFYEIRDRHGALVAIHKRRDLLDGTKDVSWLQPDGRAGLNGTPADTLPLYGAHLLAEWPELTPVVLTEGEKAADALTDAGIPAVGTVCGAAVTPNSAALDDLTGRPVILWPDNDDPGRRHMAAIAERLVEVAAVGIVDWADAPPKGDAADFLADGRTADDVRELLARAKPADAGWRTLADIDDSPAGPLLLDMFEPGPNLLYAAAGVGKGSTGAHQVVELLRLGRRPLIYDAEGRPREWARRVAGLNGDRSRVVYVTPADLGASVSGKPFWKAIDALARIVRASRADFVFVDSILPATGTGEEKLRADAQVPFLYVAALDSLGVPSVSFGHPPKGQPEGEPYGSMAWTAAMRLTWLGTKAEGDDGTHRVRWRPRKRNERGHIPAFLLSFNYDDAGRLSGAERTDDEQTIRQWLLLALADREAHGVAELADELLTDEAEYVGADRLDRAKHTLKVTLQRMARDGAVLREGVSGPKVRWRLP